MVYPELTQQLETTTAVLADVIHDTQVTTSTTTYLTTLRDAANEAQSVIHTSPAAAVSVCAETPKQLRHQTKATIPHHKS
ncbi:hypothetical protein [Mycobacterium lepromatosis]|uniref:hypothetical protein n=1 Tax=Mycobacterium lepromatosis TaxID=480418 RepID=UPI000696ADD4|nr:hypothetical protein [Mycobacterium lepromatosis]